MKKIEIEKLGQIELTQKEKELVYFNDEFQIIDNKKVELGLQLEKTDKNTIEKINTTINNLSSLLVKNEKLILEDYENKGEAEYYITEWKNEIFPQIMTDEEFSNFISDTNSNDSIEKRLLNKLQIVGIAVNTNSEEYFLTFDYAFGKDYENGFRDDMLVVRLNSKFELTHITNEG